MLNHPCNCNVYIMQIKEKISLLPTSPGVYQFLDEGGVVIYVGKAKSLRSRVSSYFTQSRDHSAKVRALVRHIVDLRHIVVDSEYDALLLENNLIKELQPRYNIMLKDSKSYPWICVSREAFPRIYSTRKLTRSAGEYFGPYASVSMQHAILELIKGLYPLRTCRHNLSEQMIARGRYSVCLEYHIGNCKGACEGKESEAEYQRYIDAAREILRGNLKPAEVFFGDQMTQLSQELKFEEAEKVKNKLLLLENYSHRSVIVSPTLTNLEVVNILVEDGVYCNRMKVVGGAVINSYTFELRNVMEESPQELLSFALASMGRLPSEVVVPFVPSTEFEGVQFTTPQRGDKVKLLELSMKNCKLFRLEKMRYLEKSDPTRHGDMLMEKMKRELQMSVEPRHIECFDNSNIQGSSPVAACVVFKDGKPSKKDYRHYNIKTVVGANDFASMREIVERRYRRLLEENQPLPQLIVIDGGKGQLGAAIGALEELGLMGKIEIVGLAKRLEELFFVGRADPVYLDKRGATLKVLMQLRDEAHRFGITFHRQKRSIHFLRSELESISGLGQVSIDKLLKKYKTIPRMRKAHTSELAELIGEKRAAIFVDFYAQKPEN